MICNWRNKIGKSKGGTLEKFFSLFQSLVVENIVEKIVARKKEVKLSIK